MDWEALAAIGELTAAVAVVFSLVYLAREIRHNTRSTEIAALRDTTAQWNQWSEMIATSPDLAEIVVRGNRSLSDLSASEKIRYGAYVQSFFDNVESSRSLIIDYAVDKNLDVVKSIVARRIAINGFSEWWTENTGDYEQAFVDWIASVATES